jgi:ATP-binding cassette subfamily C protein CydD
MKPSTYLMQKNRIHATGKSALALCVGVLIGACVIGQMALLAHIITATVIHHQHLHTVMPSMMWLAISFVLRAVLTYAKTPLGFAAGAAVRTQLRAELLQHLQKLGPIQSRTQPHSTASLSNSLLEQIESLQNFYALYLPQMGLAVMIPLAILIVVFWQNWVCGLAMLITAPLIPLFMALVGKQAATLNTQNFTALAQLGAHFLDTLTGLATLKNFFQTARQRERITRATDDYRRRTMKVLRVAFLSSAVLEFFSALAIAILAIYLGLALLGHLHFGLYGHTIGLGAALFILLLAPEFYAPLKMLGTYYHARAEAIAAAEHLQEILDMPLPTQAAHTQKPLQAPFELTLKNASITYSGQTEAALELPDVHIRANSMLAIVGASGAGKTTFLNMLLGWLDPAGGEIYINGQPLSNIRLKDWHAHIAYLNQTPHTFFGTLRENLQLATPNATDAECVAACEHACLTDWLHSLPQGLDTVIGEQGFGLSGGQARRLQLARVFLKDTQVVFLDEPTSSLDADTAAQIFKNIASFCHNRTTVLLTHQIDQLKTADHILVLDHGKIIEQGTYAACIKHKKQLYRLLQEGKVYA